MKDVMALIEKRKQEFAELPFFRFLEDQNIHPKQRLSFAPYFAPFVMGFGEFNMSLWREEPTSDPIQKIINQNTREDDDHWIYFLEDLRKLGFNIQISFSDALRLLWSKEMQVSRQMIYELYRYTYHMEPILKLTVIEAIETTADVFLKSTAKAVKELQAITNEEYQYFGNYHCLLDANHSIYSSETEQFIKSVQLTEQTRQEAFELVDTVFRGFTDFFYVLFEYARNQKIAPFFKYSLDTRPTHSREVITPSKSEPVIELITSSH